MEYKNIEVVLTVYIGGAQAINGLYDFKQTGIAIEKDEEGVISKYPVGKLVIKRLPVTHDCAIHTTLRSSFAEWAITDESRPQRTVSAPYWRNLSKKNRLKYHIEKYVQDLYGDAEFVYEIME